mgnify:CR=1 FL=1
MTEKFVVPFFNGASIQIVKDEKNKPVFYDREVVEEIIKPVRGLIAANDRRRENAKSV